MLIVTTCNEIGRVKIQKTVIIKVTVRGGWRGVELLIATDLSAVGCRPSQALTYWLIGMCRTHPKLNNNLLEWAGGVRRGRGGGGEGFVRQIATNCKQTRSQLDYRAPAADWPHASPPPAPPTRAKTKKWNYALLVNKTLCAICGLAGDLFKLIPSPRLRRAARHRTVQVRHC